MTVIENPGMFGQDIERWSSDHIRYRRAKIAYRERPAPHELRPECREWQGKEITVHCPRIMEASEDGGHSLYAGRVCWDIDPEPGAPPLPMLYICGDDLEWIEA